MMNYERVITWPTRLEIVRRPDGGLAEVTFESPSGSQTYALVPLPRQCPPAMSLEYSGGEVLQFRQSPV